MKPKVLFLCTGNSARSQMAEGYLRHVANDRFEAMSAGIEPKGLNPLAVEVMGEIGIDISKQTSKDEEEKYTLVLANPPFAGSLDYESCAKDLQQVVKTKKTELLFLAL